MKAYCSKASTLILCLLISTTMILAVPKDNGKAKGKEPQAQSSARDEKGDRGKEAREDGKEKNKDVRVSVGVFVKGDQDIIRRHYLGNTGNLPPGLAKRNGDLPPGLEKQLRRNGHLPPGLEKKLNPFPVELERRLPPLREGLMRGVIGGSAVIIERKTSRIVDVFGIF